ncbi:MAG: hypothetical protein GWN30_01165, partial [Gammaproteobacteria bacterium]|nr:hypothetical protein [Gammaproteobacteria bacterium]NIW97452.1 hypothetical protein [Phycisphaerae bacterium]
MTDQNHTQVSKSNRIYLFCFLTVILLIGAWIAYFIISFDLNDYRRHAEQRLASILSLPVAIGEMEYKFHGSRLALEITGIQIGDKNTPAEINAPKLLVDLQWSGLLQRDFRFGTISLLRPYI